MDAVRLFGRLLGNEQVTSAHGRSRWARAASARPGAGAMAKGPCPCCEGQGAFNTWAKPCRIGHMHEKMRCPACQGERLVVGADAYTKCGPCDGKGGFDLWGKPSMQCSMHFKTTCATCNGSCYLPPPAPAQAPSDLTASVCSFLGGLTGSNDARRNTPDTWTGLQADQRNERALLMVRALVNAAKCDGKIDADEQRRITEQLGDMSSEEYRMLLDEFSRPIDIDELARSVPIGMEEEIYALSLTAIKADTRDELEYLRKLSVALRLSASTCDRLHRQTR